MELNSKFVKRFNNMISNQTIDILNFYHDKYNKKDFIKDDPISIPHRFSKKQDIEIAGLFAATLAWGNRTSIINSCNKLMTLMDNQPYNFIINHSQKELKPFETFVHRTFNATDVLYFISFLKHHFKRNDSLENLFLNQNIELGLSNFKQHFFSLEDFSERTKKTTDT